jgi:hypothetical protein
LDVAIFSRELSTMLYELTVTPFGKMLKNLSYTLKRRNICGNKKMDANILLNSRLAAD